MDETLSVEEQQKVEAAAEFVGGLLAREKKVALDTALDIGSYILDHFYEGSERSYRTHGHGTPALHALIDKLELGSHTISLRHLHNYVVAAIQARRWDFHIKAGRMDKDVEKVQLTSRLHLAKCRKVTDEIRIAKEAVDESLSTRQVLERVQEANSTEPSDRRSERDHEAIIAAVQVNRTLGALEDSGWQELELEQLGWLWRTLCEQIGRLGALRTEVEVRMQELGVTDGDYYWPGEEPVDVDDVLSDVLVDTRPGSATSEGVSTGSWMARGRQLVADIAELPVGEQFGTLKSHLNMVMDAADAIEAGTLEQFVSEGLGSGVQPQAVVAGDSEQEPDPERYVPPMYIEGDILAEYDEDDTSTALPVQEEAVELADDDLGNCGYDPDDEHPFGPMAGSGMSLSERVFAHCTSPPTGQDP